MFSRLLDVLLVVLIVVFFLPSLAWHAGAARVNFLRARSTRLAHSQADPATVGLRKPKSAPEFNFERAIHAYEELIDSTSAEGRS